MKNENLTFSQKVKNEILQNEKNLSSCCALAYLTAIIRGNGSLAISQEGLGFCIVSGNVELLKFVNTLSKKLIDKQSDIIVEGKGKKLYSMEIYDTELMYDMGIVVENNGMRQISTDISNIIKGNDCCKKSFVKGMFLSCGSLSIPDITNIKQEVNTTYHMEFQLNDNAVAKQFCDMLCDMEFGFKLTTRSSSSVVYLKDKDVIADMMVYLGANTCKFMLEDIIIARSLRNDANRQTNCISANIDKTIDASEKQISAITKLIEAGKLNLLDEKLRQTADMRMQYTDATMDELADKLGVTKSGVNHRLRKLIELSEEI